ncbi:MAG TPA: hypothetical protein VIH27_04715 [Nitrososphaerales archaeon]
MSEGSLRLKIKFGLNEVEIEGSIQDITKAVEIIQDIIKVIPNIILEKNHSLLHNSESDHLDNYISTADTIKSKELITTPEMQIDKNDSLSDIIIKLFTNSWGRNPRKLNEIRETLQSFGQIFPKQSVAVALLRLAQSGRLRRFKGDNGEYVYTASTSLAFNSNTDTQ